MGIYDREYYRREGPSISEAWGFHGRACRYLVLINVAMFILQLVSRQPQAEQATLGPLTEWLAMKPVEAFSGFQVWRFVTGAFLHDPFSFTHILFNMLLLWFLGPDVEDLYGPKEFAAFYVLAGTFANVVWGLTALGERWGAGGVPLALGASGAVMAVMVVAACHFPQRTVYLMWFIPVPLWLLAIFTVAGDLFMFVGRYPTQVAVAAHLAGAGFGLVYYKLNWRILNGRDSLLQLFRRSSKPRLRVYREADDRVLANVERSSTDEQLEAKADAILEKVSQQGMGSLSPEERETLRQASEAIRKRRT